MQEPTEDFGFDPSRRAFQRNEVYTRAQIETILRAHPPGTLWASRHHMMLVLILATAGNWPKGRGVWNAIHTHHAPPVKLFTRMTWAELVDMVMPKLAWLRLAEWAGKWWETRFNAIQDVRYWHGAKVWQRTKRGYSERPKREWWVQECRAMSRILVGTDAPTTGKLLIRSAANLPPTMTFGEMLRLHANAPKALRKLNFLMELAQRPILSMEDPLAPGRRYRPRSGEWWEGRFAEKRAAKAAREGR